MKIAIASQTKTSVTGHTGRCQRFWVYTVDNAQVQDKTLLELSKEQSFHESSPQDSHPLDGVQVIIGNTIGQGLARRLEGMGIQPIATSETNLDAAIAQYLAGTLPILAPGAAHHHGADHDETDPNCHCHDAPSES